MSSLYIPEKYSSLIKERGRNRYLAGLLVRAIKRLRYFIICKYARLKGAHIGNNTIIPFSLARIANSNLFVGNDVIIESSDIDLRSKVSIMDHVIINKGVSIIRVSHEIDDSPSFSTKYYDELRIEQYSWVANLVRYFLQFRALLPDPSLGLVQLLLRIQRRMGYIRGTLLCG